MAAIMVSPICVVPEVTFRHLKWKKIKVLTQLHNGETVHSNSGVMAENQIAYDHVFMNLLNMLTSMLPLH